MSIATDFNDLMELADQAHLGAAFHAHRGIGDAGQAAFRRDTAPLSTAILEAMESWPLSVPTIRSRIVRVPSAFGFDDFRHGHAEAFVDNDDFATRDQAVVHVNVDRFADLAFEQRALFVEFADARGIACGVLSRALQNHATSSGRSSQAKSCSRKFHPTTMPAMTARVARRMRPRSSSRWSRKLMGPSVSLTALPPSRGTPPRLRAARRSRAA